MQSNRRSFCQLSAASLAATLSGVGIDQLAAADDDATTQDAPSPSSTWRPNPIAISTYSFWRYRDDAKLTIPRCIDLAAEYGFDAVEILKVQMEEESDSYLQQLKRRAWINGLDLCAMSTHQDFVSPDKDERRKNVQLTIDLIEMAYKMGIPTIRVNTGRWRTIESFDDLMANRGIEPNLEGYTDDDGFKWVIDSLAECLPTAEKCGVTLGLENHWGLGRTAEGVLRIVRAIDSPWLQATMDTGNFFERREEQFRMMAEHTVFVQAKTYFGGGTWYTIDMDYDQIAKILQKANYRGYICLEFEGKEDYQTAIPKSLQVLREAFGKKQP